MMVFILILLLLAAVFGILGIVVKAALFLVLTALLTLAILVALGWWALKRSARRYTSGSPSPGPDALPPTRDDRY
jgi:UPF0716 family protein affecting phage T7 exclusion